MQPRVPWSHIHSQCHMDVQSAEMLKSLSRLSPQQVAGHLTVLNPQEQKFSELVLGWGESLKLADNPFFPHQWGVSSSLFSSGVAAL